jgi:hypothetical protein
MALSHYGTAMDAVTTLSDLAEIRAGYPFRGKIEEEPNGDVLVVQMKDVSVETGINSDTCVRTRLPGGRKQPQWLQPGDIVFTARGNRNVATLAQAPPERTVLSPHLFHITVRDPRAVLPAFLAWQINQEPGQEYLAKMTEGSFIRSIRRQVLESMPIQVLPVDRQHRTVQLFDLAQKETAVLERLADNRRRELRAVARDLLHPTNQSSSRPREDAG